MLKKLCKILLAGAALLAGAVVLPFLLGPAADDLALGRYRSEVLENLALPPGTGVVEVVSGCGNTSGTGNHTELYVGILVKTSLSEEAWAALCPDSRSVSAQGPDTPAMGGLGLSFAQLETAEGVYILEFSTPAPFSDFDLRGH